MKITLWHHKQMTKSPCIEINFVLRSAVGVSILDTGNVRSACSPFSFLLYLRLSQRYTWKIKVCWDVTPYRTKRRVTIFFKRIQCLNIHGKGLQEESPWAAWNWILKLKCILSSSYPCTSVTISNKHRHIALICYKIATLLMLHVTVTCFNP
jgi:hypothetical protein